jgi:hypothetical protein
MNDEGAVEHSGSPDALTRRGEPDHSTRLGGQMAYKGTYHQIEENCDEKADGPSVEDVQEQGT